MINIVEMPGAPLISIAIATYNRSALLKRALDSLCCLDPNAEFQLEVVVIDNGSTDDTRNIVLSFSEARFPIRWFYEEKAGLPFARNRAVKESQGKWIAFFDDDQLAAPDWLNVLYAAAQAEKLMCVGGARTLRIEADRPPSTLPMYTRMLLGEIAEEEAHFYHKRHLPCTGNVLIQRMVFDRVGQFDESVLDGGEDTDFFNRVLDAGIQAKYVPKAKVEHIIAARRLEADYLQHIAFRHGNHVCRRDLILKGGLYAAVSGVLRIILLAVPCFWSRAFFSAIGKRQHAIAASCKWSRVLGYWSFLKHRINNASFDQTKTMHRGKG